MPLAALLTALKGEFPNKLAPGNKTVDGILRATRAHLGMDVGFVSEFCDGQRYFRHVNAAGDAPIRPGECSPLEESFCQRVVDGRLPQLIPDASEFREAMALSVTTEPPVGAHLSVPIRLRDGRVYGTLCCFSFAPNRTLNERDLGVMRAFADVTAIEIERDLDLRDDHDERVARIKAALEGQMSMVYQPIYTIEDLEVAGLECLARFSGTPYRTPDMWFAEAEDVGLAAKLELQAIGLGISILPSLPPTVYVALNVSPKTLLSGDLAETLTNCPAHRLILEVTEHTSIDDYAELKSALAPFRMAGVRLAIDDAGAGFASFRHVLSLEPDIIKLDISLTRGIDADRGRRALASALTRYAHEMGSLVVAEGVETASELTALREIGTDCAQGYLLGRPLPLEGASNLCSTKQHRGGLLGVLRSALTPAHHQGHDHARVAGHGASTRG